MQQDLEEPFGPGDYDPVIADPLDPAAANHVASRVARDPLGGGILEEGAALGAVQHHAVEDGLAHGPRRGPQRLASCRVEEIPGRNHRVARHAGVRLRRCGGRRWGAGHARRRGQGQRPFHDERAHNARGEGDAHDAEQHVDDQEPSRHG